MNLVQAIAEAYRGQKFTHEEYNNNQYICVEAGYLTFYPGGYGWNPSGKSIGWKIYNPPLLLEDLRVGQKFKFKNSEEVHTVVELAKQGKKYYLGSNYMIWEYSGSQKDKVILVE